MTKHLQFTLTVLLLTLFMIGCNKDDATTNSSQFTDNLTLGTGLNSSNLFQLTGESTTFSGSSVIIYWRLESKDDMAGSAISIKIEKLVNGSYTTVQTFPYTNPQNYGHIMLSTFVWIQNGSFRATGILNATSKTVATREFSVQP
jgi:hypothetical protein